jgi:hypothetical protein
MPINLHCAVRVHVLSSSLLPVPFSAHLLFRSLGPKALTPPTPFVPSGRRCGAAADDLHGGSRRARRPCQGEHNPAYCSQRFLPLVGASHGWLLRRSGWNHQRAGSRGRGRPVLLRGEGVSPRYVLLHGSVLYRSPTAPCRPCAWLTSHLPLIPPPSHKYVVASRSSLKWARGT